MSWVEELKAMSQKKARVYRKALLVGIVSATPAKLTPIINWVIIIQNLFDLKISTKGLQKGFITQGKYSQLVKSAISVFEISSFLYKIVETIMTKA